MHLYMQVQLNVYTSLTSDSILTRLKTSNYDDQERTWRKLLTDA